MLKSDNYIFARRFCSAYLSVVLAAIMIIGIPFAVHAGQKNAVVQAAFGDECETLLITNIRSARNSINVAIYSMTRRNISDALTEAVKRGVRVHLKYDASSAEDSDGDQMKKQIAFMAKRGVKCTAIRMPNERTRMHHKFAVIDDKLVVTGSYNFTTAATTANYENLVVIESPEVAKSFQEEFERIKSK